MNYQWGARFEANAIRRLDEIALSLDELGDILKEIKANQRTMKAELIALETLVQELVHDEPKRDGDADGF